MSLQNWILSVGVIVALALGVISVTKPQPQPEPSVSSVTSNSPLEPFYAQGGITSRVQQFQSTTTVACAIQNPLGATTTFAQAAWTVPTATTTTTVIAIATTTNANRYATTTALLSKSVAALQATVTYRPTSNNDILGPTDWVIVGYDTGTTLPLVAQQQKGFCSVMFNVIR